MGSITQPRDMASVEVRPQSVTGNPSVPSVLENHFSGRREPMTIPNPMAATMVMDRKMCLVVRGFAGEIICDSFSRVWLSSSSRSVYISCLECIVTREDVQKGREELRVAGGQMAVDGCQDSNCTRQSGNHDESQRNKPESHFRHELVRSVM